MPTVSIKCRVRALYPFKSNDPSSLSFDQGDSIEVLTKLESGWWDGWCKGARGWFPSNYVEIIEEYKDESCFIVRETNAQNMIMENKEKNFICLKEHDLPATLVNTAKADHAVPLRRNNEYRLSLPYQGSGMDLLDNLAPPTTHERSNSFAPHSMTNIGTTLPPNWSLQMTEDKSGCYFYNHATGEMRSTHPDDVSESEFDDDLSSQRLNGSIDSEREDNDDNYDYKSVDSRPWDERSTSDRIDSGSFSEKPIMPWMRRTLSQGQSYLPPIPSQDFVKEANSTDSENNRSITRPSFEDTPQSGTSDDLSGSDKGFPPRPFPRSPSRRPSARRTSVIDSHEPLTWNKLSAHVALAIHNLNTAAKNLQAHLFLPYAAVVVNAIRTMLFTSGTIDKESQYIRTHAILRAHHRSMMASMSKLVLSAQLSVDNANDNISKMLSESNELLVAVRNFVITCQDIPIPVQHIDPRLLDSSEAAEKTAKIESLAAADGSRAQYALQNDLADNLEAYGTSMQESVDSIIGSIKSDQYQNNTSFSLSALLFTQFRNLSNQTGQFLGIVEDIDFDGVSSSPLLSELYACKQRLSDGVGLLFYQMQTLTDESTSIQSNVAAMEKAARHVSEPIRDICEYVKNLVAERKTILEQSNATAKTTQSDAHNSDTIRNTAIEEEDETDELGKSSVLDRFSTDAETVVGTQTDPLESSVDNAGNNDKATADGRSSVQSLDIEKRDQTANSPSSRSGTVVASPSSEQRSPTTPDGPSKTTAKLKKFFGDDAPAAVAAATKPTSKERPWFLQYDYDPSEIVFNMEGYVKGGTLPALVERLTMHDYLDMNFINTFLLTYRSFATSVELLELLEQRYNIVPPPNLTDEEMETWTQKKLKLVRLRVFNVLKNWLELYYNEEDHVILDRLTEFTNTTIRHSLSFSCDQLERLIRKRQEAETQGGLKKMVLTLPDPPEPILPRNRRKFRLLDIDPLEMARQLTIMDFKLYSSIRPVECLDKSWSRDANDEKGSVAVNIRASIEYCNQVTSWVSDAILSQSEIKKRSNLIKYWVQVAEKCRLLNNFNTCMAILSAFDNSSVGRLKRTWEMVGARTNQTLGNIRKLMGANRNFTEYRAIIHSINPPCIPFLGIYLQDLTFIEDGNTNYLKKSKQLINFAKRAKTAEVIREIQQYQSSLYQLKSVEELQAFIQANLQSTRDEEQLYKESLKLEPREREDEKITRLLQESGFL